MQIKLLKKSLVLNLYYDKIVFCEHWIAPTLSKSKGWVQQAAIALATPPKYHFPILFVLSVILNSLLYFAFDVTFAIYILYTCISYFSCQIGVCHVPRFPFKTLLISKDWRVWCRQGRFQNGKCYNCLLGILYFVCFFLNSYFFVPSFARSYIYLLFI